MVSVEEEETSLAGAGRDSIPDGSHLTVAKILIFREIIMPKADTICLLQKDHYMTRFIGKTCAHNRERNCDIKYGVQTLDPFLLIVKTPGII